MTVVQLANSGNQVGYHIKKAAKMLELVFTRRFCMAHRLIHCGSDVCAVPHGHNEYVTVYFQSRQTQSLNGVDNMVVPFEMAKARWHKFVDNSLDHSLQLAEDDPLLGWFCQYEPVHAKHIMTTPGDPTTELLACLLLAKLQAILAEADIGLQCNKIKIEETPTNTVEFSGDPLVFIPHIRPKELCWWHRSDMSIADNHFPLS